VALIECICGRSVDVAIGEVRGTECTCGKRYAIYVDETMRAEAKALGAELARARWESGRAPHFDAEVTARTVLGPTATDAMVDAFAKAAIEGFAEAWEGERRDTPYTDADALHALGRAAQLARAGGHLEVAGELDAELVRLKAIVFDRELPAEQRTEQLPRELAALEARVGRVARAYAALMDRALGRAWTPDAAHGGRPALGFPAAGREVPVHLGAIEKLEKAVYTLSKLALDRALPRARDDTAARSAMDIARVGLSFLAGLSASIVDGASIVPVIRNEDGARRVNAAAKALR